MDRRIARLTVGLMVMAVALVMAGPLLSPSAHGALAAYGPKSTTTTTVSSTITTAPTSTTTIPPGGTTTIPAGGTTISESQTVIGPGGSLTVSGTGFHPLETITIDINSGGASNAEISIGTTTSTSTGTFSLVVTIPADLPTGEHVITATDTSGHSLSEDIELVSSTTTGGLGPTGSSSSGSGALASTGTDIALTAGAGAAAIALGGLLVLGVRRRRSAWTK
jgi:hypothetical protein